MKKLQLVLISILLIVICTIAFIGCELSVLHLPPNSHTYVIHNPYDDIDWSTIEYHDGNFHTHTVFSDGRILPHDVIDAYQALGYSVLALTDHNTSHYQSWPSTLYPWNTLHTIAQETDNESWQDRNPSILDMIAVQGSEISQNDDIGSLFNDFVGIGETEAEALGAIETRGGLSIFYHPGRYDRSDQWYVDMFLQFPSSLLGIEIYNQKDRYPEDRDRWDRILFLTMPERPVWGFGNDDMHSYSHLGWNRNVLLLPQLTETAVFESLSSGEFFVFKPYLRMTMSDIRISNITVSDHNITLDIEGEYNSIHWITYYSGTQESEVIAVGTTFSTVSLPEDSSFVRAVLFSANGMLYTQPFGMTVLD